jgi:hypothetical protein
MQVWAMVAQAKRFPRQMVALYFAKHLDRLLARLPGPKQELFPAPSCFLQIS